MQRSCPPDEPLIPPGDLPPLQPRDLPPPIPLRQMIGPSVILAGLALGSGEFVLWPYLTFKSQFVFFWACLAAVTMQYFLNLEIMRWTLATGESALTGIIRLTRHLAPVLLLLNVIPWMIPAWANGAAQLAGWLLQDPLILPSGKAAPGPWDTWLAMGGLVLCGAILTAGPVVYETVERVQLALVTLILLLVVGLAAWLVKDRPDALATQVRQTLTLGWPRFVPPREGDLTPMVLLGALAFAGAGGTMNLCQSNYIRDKGYAMGNHVGRITSPLTGREEPIVELGYYFPHTPQNLQRWAAWWRSACWEHGLSFWATCVLCLVLLTLISYVCFYDAAGQRHSALGHYEGMAFIWGQATRLTELVGPTARWVFLLMGIAILFTTEFGVLDAASRVSTDIVKVAWLREHPRWSESRLYFLFLWGEILLACGVLLLERYGLNVGGLALFQFTSAMNGGVMFLYSTALLWTNWRRLPPPLRIPPWRLAILGLTVLFFGFFSVWALLDTLARLG